MPKIANQNKIHYNLSKKVVDIRCITTVINEVDNLNRINFIFMVKKLLIGREVVHLILGLGDL